MVIAVLVVLAVIAAVVYLVNKKNPSVLPTVEAKVEAVVKDVEQK